MRNIIDAIKRVFERDATTSCTVISLEELKGKTIEIANYDNVIIDLRTDKYKNFKLNENSYTRREIRKLAEIAKSKALTGCEVPIANTAKRIH